jgi:glutaconate CoA-transferase subunit B
MTNNTPATDYTLAEICITAAAEAWRNDGEVFANGFGPVPRIAAALAKLTINPDLLLTDGEAFLVSEPVPVGPRKGYQPKVCGWMPYSKVFDLVYRGKRHAMTGPSQIDRFGQTNISFIGKADKPKAALLGVRGFPGNTVSHANSMWAPSHDKRTFVEGEVDMVAGAGYNPARFKDGRRGDTVDLRIIVSNLAVMDFGGTDKAIRAVSLHPGITFEQVQENTGFALEGKDTCVETPAPTEEQLRLIREVIDPHNMRAMTFKDDPPGDARKRANG